MGVFARWGFVNVSSFEVFAAPLVDGVLVVPGVGGASVLFYGAFVVIGVWVLLLLVAGLGELGRVFQVVSGGVETFLGELTVRVRRAWFRLVAAFLAGMVAVLSFYWFEREASTIPVAALEEEFGVDLGNLQPGQAASGFEPTLVQVEGLRWASIIRTDRNMWVVHEFTVK